ncbi:hypothetical protein [uncultured Lutibacter sp.]|uniref:hypothetical protein n=1 Tax=uncultured Lutibacter sp. TaxID=437739 RepID=UPI002603AF73|nr:hypothetical protein [uncultured Lutibacter sp.]
MISTNELTDNELLKRIENCTLSPSFLTHEVLLRLSYILIKKYGIDEAINKTAEIKENYFINALNSNKFNRTLTRAYTEILYYFMQNSPKNASFEKILRDFPRLRYNFKNLVKTHYGYDILKEHRKEEPSGMKPILFTF